MRKLWIIGLLLPAIAAAGDRLSSLAVSQDNHYTAMSTITCKIAASRLSKASTYSGVVNFQWKPAGNPDYGYNYTATFEVSPAAPTYTEVQAGSYSTTATLTNGRVLVKVDFPVPLSPDDVVLCNAHIDLGDRSAPVGAIYTADMEYVDHSN